VNRILLKIAAVLTLPLSSPTYAQTTTSDVRCLLLSNAFATGSSNPAAKGAAKASASFYLGRIDGRWSDSMLRAAITREQTRIKVASAGPEMQRCLERMQASVRKLQGVVGKTARK